MAASTQADKRAASGRWSFCSDAPPPLQSRSRSRARPSRSSGQSFAELLQQLAPVPIALALNDVTVGEHDTAASGERSGVVASFHGREGSGPVLIGADHAFLNAVLEAALGADGSEAPAVSNNGPTRMGNRLAKSLFEQMAGALAPAVPGTEAVPLELDKIETAVEMPATSGRADPVFVASFGLSIPNRKGQMFLVLPQSMLAGDQQSAAAPLGPNQTVQDPRWSRRIEEEVNRTQVTLRAILDEPELMLGEVTELRVGQVLPLRATPRSNVKVVCNDETLFWCELGQTKGVYTLRVKEFASNEQGLIDAITSL